MEEALRSGSGIAHGRLLLDFAEAAHLGTPDLVAARQALAAAVGDDGLVEACLTVSAFNGLTRVADATGIALDGGTLDATTDLRTALGLNDFNGAGNTPAAGGRTGAPRLTMDVRALFSDA